MNKVSTLFPFTSCLKAGQSTRECFLPRGELARTSELRGGGAPPPRAAITTAAFLPEASLYIIINGHFLIASKSGHYDN